MKHEMIEIIDNLQLHGGKGFYTNKYVQINSYPLPNIFYFICEVAAIYS